MKVVIVGTGYVGLVTGACFSQMGNTVTCIDIDVDKIENLKKGILPIYEPGLDSIVKENYQQGTLKFSTDLGAALKDAEICFIAVGTPTGEDGSADLKFVLKVAEDIGKNMVARLVVVDKSTVPVGTADLVEQTIKNRLAERNLVLEVSVVSNPEFLKEGAAVDDFMKPDRIVLGTRDGAASRIMRELYKPFTFSHDRIIEMDVRSAEMTKYAANAMLATKISFMNEIANICENVGADVNKVRVGIGSDSRIGYSFIYPGIGYGGSCFPKDVKALLKTAKDSGHTPHLLQAVENVNEKQKGRLVQKVEEKFGANLKDHCFAIWGLSFKPETDDMREAPSITVVKGLISRGATVKVYDPKAAKDAEEYYFRGVHGITYCANKYEAVQGADALLLVTEWKEFRSPDFEELSRALRRKIIFDGRNQYNSEKLKEYGIDYVQIGVSNTRR